VGEVNSWGENIRGTGKREGIEKGEGDLSRSDICLLIPKQKQEGFGIECLGRARLLSVVEAGAHAWNYQSHRNGDVEQGGGKRGKVSAPFISESSRRDGRRLQVRLFGFSF